MVRDNKNNSYFSTKPYVVGTQKNGPFEHTKQNVKTAG